MPKVVVVVGLPGVGKSTVLSLAVKKLSERGFRVKLVNFGDYMLKQLKESGLVETRDEIRRLPLRAQADAQEAAARAIRRDLEGLGEDAIAIVDTHAVVRTPLGYWPGLPLRVVEELRPDLIVVVEARPEEIVARQQRDASRYRGDLASLELVREMREVNRYFAIASSVVSGAIVKFVDNPEGLSERAAEELVKAIEAV